MTMIIGYLHEKKRIIIGIAVILAGVFLILFTNAAISGYTTYNKIKNSNYSFEDYGADMHELRTQLLVCESNLSSSQAFNERLLLQSENTSHHLFECASELDFLKSNYTSYKENAENRIEELTLELADMALNVEELNNQNYIYETEISNLQNQYDILAKNTANNLCCKAKVDNPGIKYYKVENNRVSCLEEGTLKISC